MDGTTRSTSPDGFTLIELLIVIVILGVLAVVVVFAVGGIQDRGEVAAAESDEHTLVTAEEAYRAQNGSYASEIDLVNAGLLRDESTLFDIDVASDLSSYTIGASGSFDGGGGGGAPTPQSQSYATPAGDYDATVLDQGGTRLLVIIGEGTETPALWDLLMATPPADTNIVWFDPSGVTDTDDVDAIMNIGADYVIAPYSVGIANTSGGGTTFVGTYMNDQGWSSPGQYWWTFGQGNNSPTLAQIEAGLA